MARQLERGEFNPAPSPEAEENAHWQAFMWAALGDEIKKYLAAKIPNNGNRTVASLQKHELQGIAWATVCSYLALRANRLQQLEQNGKPKEDGLSYLLS